MNPILYDIKRCLFSKTFLAILILMLGLSTIVGYFMKQLAGVSSTGSESYEEQSFLTSISLILTIFVPLLGLMIGYDVYGKERLTSTLESVIVQPVTKMRIVISRFVAGVFVVGSGF